ncbi:ABC transporter ATP-binding protein [Nonomuraea sp. NPDC048916]|uniref:ABC transporter ATP-binding protein n=1 Tax=Nonomuraea sp. NPDC048916 TaxID=3154232 RepID=UPI0033FC4528
MSIIEVSGLRFSYGPVEVLHGIDLKVDEGEIIAVIGPNGAGKTTLLNLLGGAYRPRSGSITLRGDDVTRASQDSLVRRGLSLVPEGRQMFSSMTVDDNLLLGTYARRREIDLDGQREMVFELFPRLRERRDQLAGTLSGGEQQMVAIGRALMSDPSVLLLDEPSLGLAPQFVDLIMRTIRRLRENGRTVVLVEQNAKAALRLADRAYLLEIGTVHLEGPARELARDPRVVAVYLGGDAAL